MEWILQQRFRAMLVALVMFLFVYPVFEEFEVTRIAFDSFRTILFVLAFVIIFKVKRLRVLAMGMAVPTFAGIWTYSFFGNRLSPALDSLFHFVAAAFLGIAVATILRKVYDDEDVTSDSICGAFCGYLLVGVIFGHLFSIAEILRPDSFIMSEQALVQFRNDDRGRYLLTYFSMITITTVGYGDVTPATATTRGLAMIEAVAGQFYIAVLVAELIGKRVAQAVTNRHSQNPDV